MGYRNISASSSFAGNTVIDVQAGTLTIDGYTESRELYGINGGGKHAALSVRSGAALEVRSVKIANARYGIIAEQDSTVLVNAQSRGSSDSSYTITEVTTSILSIGATVTIDGVSTLCNSGGRIQSPAIELSGGDTLTVKDGTIDGYHAIHQDANALESSTIIIEGGTVQDSSGSYAAAIYTEGTADIQIRGGTLKVPQTQLGNAVEGLGNTTLVMSGGSIVRGSNRDGYGIHITGIGDVIISGGTIDMPNGGLSIREGTFSIIGGTIKGSNAVLIGYYVDTNLTPGVVTGSITGGDLQGGSYGVRGTFYSPDDADGTNIVINGAALIKGGVSALYTNRTGYITMEGGYVGDNSSNTAACVPEGKVLIASKLHEGYYALADADPAVVIIKSANVEFQGQIQLQFTLDFPENVLADEGAYVTFEKAEKTTKKFVSEGTAQEEGVTFTIPVPAPEYADDIVVRVYGGDDSQLTLKSAGGTDYTEDGFAYSVKTYAQNKSQSGSTEEMRNLAKALDDYGMTSQIYFGYGDYTDLTVDGAVTAVTLDDLAPYALTTSGTKPVGVTGASIMVAFDTDNTLRITFKTDGSKPLTDYSFLLDDAEKTPTKSGKNAILQVKNIAAPNLDTPHTFTVTDGTDTYTVTASALSYAYTSVKNGSEERKNLGKALYLYNMAANDQFDN